MPFYPIFGAKNQNLKKKGKKCLGILPRRISVPKITIIAWVVPQIQCGQAFSQIRPFLPFYPIFGPKYQNFQKMKTMAGDIITVHKCTKNYNHSTCSSSDTVGTSIFLILGYFLPFYPIFGPKNQNFIKMKEVSGDIIILHKCTKNHNHSVCSSSDTVRKSFSSIWTIFSPFTPFWAKKIKIFKK